MGKHGDQFLFLHPKSQIITPIICMLLTSGLLNGCVSAPPSTNTLAGIENEIAEARKTAEQQGINTDHIPDSFEDPRPLCGPGIMIVTGGRGVGTCRTE
jgi:hypothetical protein